MNQKSYRANTWSCSATLPHEITLHDIALVNNLMEDAVELKLQQITGSYAATIASGFELSDEAPGPQEEAETVPTTPEQEEILRQAVQEAVSGGYVTVPAEPTGYEGLQAVLDDAFAQAAHGKGKERHACDRAFEDQPMQQISNLLQSNDGMAYQAIKKIQEAQRMDKAAAERELLGAIIYVAGMVIRLRGGES